MEVRFLDSAGAPLGVTGQPAVIPTGATNEVRSGTEESLEHITLSIQVDFFRQDGQDSPDN